MASAARLEGVVGVVAADGAPEQRAHVDGVAEVEAREDAGEPDVVDRVMQSAVLACRARDAALE